MSCQNDTNQQFIFNVIRNTLMLAAADVYECVCVFFFRWQFLSSIYVYIYTFQRPDDDLII